jgi:hypothetical protein
VATGFLAQLLGPWSDSIRGITLPAYPLMEIATS